MKIIALALAFFFPIGFATAVHAADAEAAFKAQCASCHGANADSDTPVGKAMKIPPIAGQSVADCVKHVNEAANHATVKGKVSEEDLQAIATYISGID